MAYEAALSPGSLQQVYNYLRQARATGKVITNRDVRAAYEGALAAEAKQACSTVRSASSRRTGRRISIRHKAVQDENTRRYNQEWANKLEQQKQLSNSQNVLGGAALLLNAPRMASGVRDMWGTGKT